MLDARKRLFIIIGIAAGLIIVFLLLWWLLGPKPVGREVTDGVTAEPPRTAVVSEPGSLVSPPPATSATAPEPIEPSALYPQQLARVFVERFGSYSSHNNNQHVTDVLPLITPRMANWVRTQTIEQTNAYQGKLTRVVVVKSRSATDSQAVVEIGVQEVNENETGSTTAYRTGRIEMVQEGGVWKVDGFYWES